MRIDAFSKKEALLKQSTIPKLLEKINIKLPFTHAMLSLLFKRYQFLSKQTIQIRRL